MIGYRIASPSSPHRHPDTCRSASTYCRPGLPEVSLSASAWKADGIRGGTVRPGSAAKAQRTQDAPIMQQPLSVLPWLFRSQGTASSDWPAAIELSPSCHPAASGCVPGRACAEPEEKAEKVSNTASRSASQPHASRLHKLATHGARRCNDPAPSYLAPNIAFSRFSDLSWIKIASEPFRPCRGRTGATGR